MEATHGFEGREAVVLHISDPQFGDKHRFGDGEHDSLAGRLLQWLEARPDGIPPVDLVVLSGDIAERGARTEFDAARRFVDRLTAALRLTLDRVVVVPGNHDIHRGLCQSYFLEQEAEDRQAEEPYAKKWAHYEAFVRGMHGPEAFSPDEPYRFHDYPELGVVVAALNSTMRESHLVHHGWCGEQQLRWFACRLEAHTGRLRIAVVHHNVRRLAQDDDENLHDADLFTDLLGPVTDVVLHGHSHDGRQDRLSEGTLVLSTGSAAVEGEARPDDVLNQCQILRFRPDGVTRWALQYQPRRQRWVADTSLGPDGTTWPEDIAFDVPVLLDPAPGFLERATALGLLDGRFGSPMRFVDDVRTITLLRDDVASAPIRTDGEIDYLAVFGDSGEMRAVGVVDGPLTDARLDAFRDRVHVPIRSRGRGAVSELVCAGAVDDTLRRRARREGVHVKSWAEYQNLLDLSSYEEQQKDRLANDRLYPQDLYLDQRYRPVGNDGRPRGDVLGDLAETVLDDVLAEGPRFVLVLGDPGFGKSFLMRRVTHLLLDGHSGVTPIVVLLKEAEKRHSLEAMVAPALVSTSASFQSERFRRMFRNGRIVMLVDGYDEFAVRVGYDRAADQLRTFLREIGGHSKIVLTTRPSHFRSRQDVTAQVFEDVLDLDVGQRRVYELEPFDEDQQREFLRRWFRRQPDPARTDDEARREADTWMAALAEVDNLPELARTPRMLSFMAERLRLDQLRVVGEDAGDAQVTAAGLYQLLVDTWLGTEADKFATSSGPGTGPGSGAGAHDRSRLDAKVRLQVSEEIAYRLWATSEAYASEAVLEDVAAAVLDLPALGLSVAEAAQEIGSRTLLVGEGDERYFAHQSIGEFLLARRLAELLRSADDPSELGTAELSELTARFLRDLAPEETTRWLRGMGGERG